MIHVDTLKGACLRQLTFSLRGSCRQMPQQALHALQHAFSGVARGSDTLSKGAFLVNLNAVRSLPRAITQELQTRALHHSIVNVAVGHDWRSRSKTASIVGWLVGSGAAEPCQPRGKSRNSQRSTRHHP